MTNLTIHLRTLTPLWTGGVDQSPDRLHETGLIGSLRWWYEALVRGLGGYACDPTSDGRCEYDPKKPTPPEKQLCAACYLFGCTGWARKFRLRVLDAKTNQLVQNAIQANAEFVLEFVELRQIRSEEKWLLVKAIEIAAQYGALGGKTTLKPQKGPMGKDFGIVEWIRASEVQKPKDVAAFLGSFRQGKYLPEYPNLAYFFFFKQAFLSRLQMNPLLGLNEREGPCQVLTACKDSYRGKKELGRAMLLAKSSFHSRLAVGAFGAMQEMHKCGIRFLDVSKSNLAVPVTL